MTKLLPASLKVTVPLILLGFAVALSALNLIYQVPRAERAVEADHRERLLQELSRLQSTLEYLQPVLDIGVPAFMSTPIAALTCASITQSQGATEPANAEDADTAAASSVVAKHCPSFRKAMPYLPKKAGKSNRQYTLACSPPASNNNH